MENKMEYTVKWIINGEILVTQKARMKLAKVKNQLNN